MNKNFGFTLLEILSVLIIFLILISIAIPSYHHFIILRWKKLTISQISKEIQYARNLAIQKGQLIIYCGGLNISCDSDWDRGQIVFNPAEKNIYRIFPPIPKSFHLTWQSSFGWNHLIFNASGFTHGQQGHFDLFNKKNQHLVAKIIILSTGRIRVEDKLFE